MRIQFVAVFSFLVAAVLPASADSLVFVGPSGWSSNAAEAPASDPVRGPMQWHLAGDPTASLTYLRTATPYADALAAIHTNFTNNKIKPSVDKDVTCQGKTAHVIEFAIGPDGHKIIINRMVIPMPDGIASLTYSRADGVSFGSDVSAAETTYCAAT